MYFISYVREVGAERIERFQIPHVYITAKSSGTRNAADCKCLKGPAGREEEVAGAAGDWLCAQVVDVWIGVLQQERANCS